MGDLDLLLCPFMQTLLSLYYQAAQQQLAKSGAWQRIHSEHIPFDDVTQVVRDLVDSCILTKLYLLCFQPSKSCGKGKIYHALPPSPPLLQFIIGYFIIYSHLPPKDKSQAIRL